jgi:hypothetical protein
MDRRGVILTEQSKRYGYSEFSALLAWDGPGEEIIRNAMDAYMKECVLEAFEYVVKNTTGHSIDKEGKVEFKYKGEWISKEALFENFL